MGVKIITGCDYIKEGDVGAGCRDDSPGTCVPGDEDCCCCAVSDRLRSATFSAEEKVRAELQSELTLSHLLCPW